MAGLGEIDRVLHGFPIPHLADKNHVGRLPQRIFQRQIVGFGIYAHFALVHQRLLVAVEELDGVFDGDDVLPALAVAVIQHRRQGGRLTAAGAAQKNHQPALSHDDVLERQRQIQFLDSRNPLLDQPQHHAGAAALGEGADPKPGEIGEMQGKIELMLPVELPRLAVVHDRPHQQFRLLRHQFLIADPNHFLIDLERRRTASSDEHIRPVQFHQLARQFLKILGGLVMVVHARLRSLCHI